MSDVCFLLRKENGGHVTGRTAPVNSVYERNSSFSGESTSCPSFVNKSWKMTKKLHRLGISSIDPNNKNWAENKTGFGFKMMQKMGWTEGKGLGAKEDGTTSHIKVKKNLENQGLGAANHQGPDWRSGAIEYNNLLAQLKQNIEDQETTSSSSEDEKPVKKNKDKKRKSESSDEESDSEVKKKKKSKKAKEEESSSESEEEVKPKKAQTPKHLTYRKRFNNKNIKNYSAEDMKAILGR
ncbi:hypothetical protein PROFUN_01527 [Planoprotostelium fungivorum]|uniref:G-patch domain-containing protein n=1 Tax=Planoprotostelium fungivorum TaxID=1890364 RepID=A0A2P6NTG4_9EUKA|nr:hypothetical protein PROFUN_01527 [Planoprotostelium fungivorum]